MDVTDMKWRLAGGLTQLFAQVNSTYPKRSKASDGTLGDQAHRNRRSAHNPDRYGVVRAGDFTNDPARGFDADRFARELAESRDSRLNLVISRRRIWTRTQGWHSYYGENPHDKHCHIEVVTDNRADSRAPWNIPILSGTAPPAPQPKPPPPEPLPQQPTPISPPPIPVAFEEEDEDMVKFYQVADGGPWFGAGAILRITTTTWYHLSADQWDAIKREAAITRQPTPTYAPISHTDAALKVVQLINVRALNDAADRAT